MHDGDRQDAVLALHRLDAIDEGAHERQGRGVAADLPAVVERHHRLDLAAQRAKDEVEQVVGALDHVGVRKFLVADDDVGEPYPPDRHVAVRIKLDADHASRPGDRARPLEDVALDVVIAVGDHRAVQAEQDRVHGQRRLELLENFVAHELVVLPIGGPGGAGGEAAAFDQGEAVGCSPPAGNEQRRRAHARRVDGMLARPQEDAFAIGVEARRQRREGVGFGRQGCGK